jgi:hypothetical protein
MKTMRAEAAKKTGARIIAEIAHDLIKKSNAPKVCTNSEQQIEYMLVISALIALKKLPDQPDLSSSRVWPRTMYWHAICSLVRQEAPEDYAAGLSRILGIIFEPISTWRTACRSRFN